MKHKAACSAISSLVSPATGMFGGCRSSSLLICIAATLNLPTPFLVVEQKHVWTNCLPHSFYQLFPLLHLLGHLSDRSPSWKSMRMNRRQFLSISIFCNLYQNSIRNNSDCFSDMDNPISSNGKVNIIFYFSFAVPHMPETQRKRIIQHFCLNNKLSSPFPLSIVINICRIRTNG